MDVLEYRLKGMAQAIDTRFDKNEAALSLLRADFEALPPGITVGPVPPSSPVLNQLWVDTSGG
jgi:hypothetical protein